MEISREDYLSHWGVKGMHWGIRNNRKSSSISVGKRFIDDHHKIIFGVGRGAVTLLSATALVATIFRDDIQNFKYSWDRPWSSNSHGRFPNLR